MACVAKYNCTADEFVTSMHRHYSLSFRNEFKILLKVACSLLLVFVILITIVAIFSPYDRPAPYWAFALTSIICVYGLVYDRINVWYWRRKFRKNPNASTQIEYAFDEDSFQLKTNLGEASLKWKAFIKIVEVQDGFLFYSTKRSFFWIPFSSFEATQCIETVRELIVKNKCLITPQK